MKKRSDLFNRAFTHISEQIGPIYRELTRSANYPLGGSRTQTLPWRFVQISGHPRSPFRCCEVCSRHSPGDLFNRAFTHISEQIGPIYRELTRSANYPLGGQASNSSLAFRADLRASSKSFSVLRSLFSTLSRRSMARSGRDTERGLCLLSSLLSLAY
jgi:hypothetical protein